MLSDALNYPRNSDSAVKTIVIGGLLGLLSFLILPIFFTFGYAMRVIRSVSADESEAPEFSDWERLGVDGLKALAITLAYSILPMLVLAATVGTAIFGTFFAAGGNSRAGFAAGGLAMVGGFVALVLWLALWYVAPAGLVAFARSGRIGDAFAFGDLKPTLTSSQYLTGWALALGVLIAAGIVVSILNSIVIGIVLAPFVNFYALVVVMFIYARSIEEAKPVVAQHELPSERPAA
jgi:hypothetical protein